MGELTVENAILARECLKKGITCPEIDVNTVCIAALNYYISMEKLEKQTKNTSKMM